MLHTQLLSALSNLAKNTFFLHPNTYCIIRMFKTYFIRMKNNLFGILHAYLYLQFNYRRHHFKC